jgi:FAD/FMN-containing dehydrogenase/Fe-S oxidoreductase
MLEGRLRKEVRGEVLFDAFSRGRYATDASIYQMMPEGVVIPTSKNDLAAALAIARDEGVPVTGRGGGTSQCGQTVNSGLIVDNSRHFNGIIELDIENRRAVVEPGMVLDELNRVLRAHGLWFPVDVSTASRATIGGMAANNSCGGRSLRYGTMRNNVLAIEAILADGSEARFGPVGTDGPRGKTSADRIAAEMLALGQRHVDLIDARFPKLNRRVGGYNLDALVPGDEPINLSHLLVGSEGTLGYFTAIELKLWPVVGRRVLGVCHFPTFYQAMDATQHLVKLEPIAVELVDSTMVGLSRQIPIFRPTIEQFVRGEPAAILLVEFDEGSEAANQTKLDRLAETMGDLGFDWSGTDGRWGGMLPIADQRLQTQIAEVRKSGLNIMMSMKDQGKPVSFVEDCAVALEDLADYTDRLTQIFQRHGTTGTWYAHASVGCLHVRPVLNMKREEDVRKMRAIAEEAFDLVARYKGSHSGEHGDGIVRSEFHERMFGSEIMAAFHSVKDAFDPDRRFNPGKIVEAPKMDDRTLFRYPPDYQVKPLKVAFDWSAYPGAGGGFQGAVEMCNNNGACRKLAGGAMCPSYRVTRSERDVTRGRANTLRLAISGQLGPDAFASDSMAETLSLCVSCKACRRECPTGVDMARMKLEVAAARAARHGLSLRDRAVGYLPRFAPIASRLPGLMNLRNAVPAFARLGERIAGLSADRPLPRWRRDTFRSASVQGFPRGPEVALFVDTFNRYFEPENARAAVDVLTSAGYRILLPRAAKRSRPWLCCGRTFLSVGLVEEARSELRRTLKVLAPLAQSGVPILGLEPSCLMTLRDELPGLLPGAEAEAVAAQARLVDEFITAEEESGRLKLPLAPIEAEAHVHGHCHQKAFDAFTSTLSMLRLVPGLKVKPIESSCCGMAGAFGYQAETRDVSLAMAELSLLPAVRAAPSDALIVANGTSCRHQVADGAGRPAMHAIRVIKQALAGPKEVGLQA